MPKYRKKPIVIEAFQMTKERLSNHHDWPEWLHKAWKSNRDDPGSLQPISILDYTLLEILTLEGNHAVSLGDFIIQGVQGELYPCKEEIFHATYDAVEE